MLQGAMLKTSSLPGAMAGSVASLPPKRVGNNSAFRLFWDECISATDIEVPRHASGGLHAPCRSYNVFHRASQPRRGGLERARLGKLEDLFSFAGSCGNQSSWLRILIDALIYRFGCLAHLFTWDLCKYGRWLLFN